MILTITCIALIAAIAALVFAIDARRRMIAIQRRQAAERARESHAAD